MENISLMRELWLCHLQSGLGAEFGLQIKGRIFLRSINLTEFLKNFLDGPLCQYDPFSVSMNLDVIQRSLHHFKTFYIRPKL